MAQHVSIEVVCDLDENPDAETVAFAYHGRKYEVDVCKEHAAELDGYLNPYIAVARTAKAPAPGTASRRSTTSRQRSAEIRGWARTHGIEVADRGRIPAGVVAQFESAG